MSKKEGKVEKKGGGKARKKKDSGVGLSLEKKKV